jgi:hypothetical protein
MAIGASSIGARPIAALNNVVVSGAATAGTPLSLYVAAASIAASSLFYPTDDFSRVDHSRALQPFRQYAAAASTAGAPWYLTAQPKPSLAAEEYSVRVNHTLLNVFRQNFQTVGQPAALVFKPSTRVEAETFSVSSALPILHQYRTGFQTVGQSWRVLYQPPKPTVSAEEYVVRVNNTQIHNFRQSFQTVGQPWVAFTAPASPKVELESYAPQRAYPFPQSAATPVVSQPFALLYQKPARALEEPIAFSLYTSAAVNPNVTVPVQPPQPWLAFTTPPPARWLWNDPFFASLATTEAYPLSGTNTPATVSPFSIDVIDLNDDPWLYQNFRRPEHERALQPFRQYIPQVVLPQPWVAYTRPALPTVELEAPPPFHTDHGNALYPFLPHPAATLTFPTHGGGSGRDKRKTRKQLRKALDEQITPAVAKVAFTTPTDDTALYVPTPGIVQPKLGMRVPDAVVEQLVVQQALYAAHTAKVALEQKAQAEKAVADKIEREAIEALMTLLMMQD